MADPASLDALPTRNDAGHWLAVIEATQGTRHKLKYQRERRAFVLSGALPLGLSFPYGFLPSTRSDDGDPLDALAARTARALRHLHAAHDIATTLSTRLRLSARRRAPGR